MVSCTLYGRLGNQWFQIVNTIAHATRMNTTFAIPEHSLNKELWPNYFTQFPKLKDEDVLKLRVYQEPNHFYTPIPLEDNLLLNGYFQSELYFKEYRKEILEAFDLYNKKETDLLMGIVACHVRRGDFVGLSDKHPPVTVKYINKAIEMFPNKPIMFFSDDIQWCQDNFTKENFFFNYEEDPIKSLTLQSNCEHNIISNSTFSWVAAWMNQNPNKIVVSPSKDNWYGSANKHLSTEDLIPKEWIQIKY